MIVYGTLFSFVVIAVVIVVDCHLRILFVIVLGFCIRFCYNYVSLLCLLCVAVYVCVAVFACVSVFLLL